MSNTFKFPRSIAQLEAAGLVSEVYVVTAWKDGCVYRTRRLGYVAHRRGSGLKAHAVVCAPSTNRAARTS